jgi:alpha-L-glutamate ligase-like protein
MARSKWRFWLWPSELRQLGVLGINRRNGGYTLGCNPRSCYPRVDDKLLTKEICQARGIRVPETYAVLERNGDIRRFCEVAAGHPEFVIKPAKGAEGRGIIVIAEHHEDQYTSSSGQRLTLADLSYHLSTIISGLYSLAGQPDRAIVEQRIIRHPAFAPIAVGGTPDIRIIVYRGVPVMAMIRLPTQASRGRANLHQGAVAAGIELATGRTLGGVCQGRAVDTHPDTGQLITGFEVPEWAALLHGAMHLADGLGLGYLGVDFVLDAQLGPVVLEANARPGLAIQLANRQGLLPRLEFLDTQTPERLEIKQRQELVARAAPVR